MNIVDSCGWLEYFADGPNADFFSNPLNNTNKLIVPSICILEVFKVVLKQRGEEGALQAAALMQQGEVVNLDVRVSLSAAKVSTDLGLPLADSVILATAQLHNATVWTQDSDFKNLPGVKFVQKR